MTAETCAARTGRSRRPRKAIERTDNAAEVAFMERRQQSVRAKGGSQVMLDRLLSYAQQVLGPADLVTDCSWGHQMSVVLRLRDAQGGRWFLKSHRDRERYDAEVTAYRAWVPSLGSLAPRLRGADGSLPAIILSEVPGEPAPWPAADPRPLSASQRSAEQAVQRAAGEALRRFHEAQALPWRDFGAAKLAEFDLLKPSAAGLLGARELGRARSAVADLVSVGPAGRVPCHRDFTPRNWLVGDGMVRIVDFEWSRLDVWVSDLARLHIGVWDGRPDLREAFLAGYGRDLSDTDRRVLHGCAVLTATWLVVRARETHQPKFEDASRTALRRLIGAPG